MLIVLHAISLMTTHCLINSLYTQLYSWLAWPLKTAFYGSVYDSFVCFPTRNKITHLVGASPTLEGTWYGGSCAKNHSKKQDCNTLLQFSMVVHVQTNTINLTGTSIQVLSTVVRVIVNNKLSLLILYIWLVGSFVLQAITSSVYWPFIFCWYSCSCQPCHE